MTHVVKLLIALGLGTAAAITNWMVLALQTQPTQYVAAARELAAGTKIDEDDLLGVPIPGDTAELKRSLIPFANRSILFGASLPRTLQRGDVLFTRDLTPPDDIPQWDVIGPFELISVGDQFTVASGRSENSISSTRGNTITIAVDANFDKRTSQLLNVISDHAAANRTTDLKIVAVQVLPMRSQNSALREPGNNAAVNMGGDGITPSQSQVVYQTVSLEGIPNVPAVLLAGDFIRFVIPKEIGF